jgi:hypothetical protein
MSTTEVELLQETETQRVIRWRLGELLKVGYEWAQAMELAVRTEIDLHLATDLPGRGCPPKTAARILL